MSREAPLAPPAREDGEAARDGDESQEAELRLAEAADGGYDRRHHDDDQEPDELTLGKLIHVPSTESKGYSARVRVNKR